MVEKGVERSKSKKLLSRCSSFMSSKEHKQRAATIAQSTSSSGVASRRRRSLMTVCRSKTTYCAPSRHPPAPPLRKSNSGASGEGGGLEDIFWNLGLGLQQVCCVFFWARRFLMFTFRLGVISCCSKTLRTTTEEIHRLDQ